MESIATYNVILIMVSTATVLGISSAVAVYLGRRTKSSEDWALGGRSLPIYVIIGTQYATIMGGGALVAHVGLGYQHGWSVLTYGGILCVGKLILAYLAPWLRKQNFTTLPDVFQRFYGPNKGLQTIAALACIVVPFGWICTQLVAFGKLFSDLTGLPTPILMVGIAIFSMFLVIPAGLASVAWTDFVFGIIMIIMSVVTLFLCFDLAGGWHNIKQVVPQENIAFPGGLGKVGLYTITLWFFAIIPGNVTNQMYYQRIYAIDKASLARLSLIIAAIVFMTSEVWATLVGFSIRAAQPGLLPEKAAGWFLTQAPTWFVVLYAGFAAATIVSTIDSAIQSVAVNLTRDIYKKVINTQISDKKMLNLSRIFSVVVAITALLWAIGWPEALGWLVASYAYSSSALLFPLILGFAFRNKNWFTPYGAICSMVFGVLGSAIAQINDTSIPYVAYGLSASCSSLIIVSLLTRKYYYKTNSLVEAQ